LTEARCSSEFFDPKAQFLTNIVFHGKTVVDCAIKGHALIVGALIDTICL